MVVTWVRPVKERGPPEQSPPEELLRRVNACRRLLSEVELQD